MYLSKNNKNNCTETFYKSNFCGYCSWKKIPEIHVCIVMIKWATTEFIRREEQMFIFEQIWGKKFSKEQKNVCVLKTGQYKIKREKKVWNVSFQLNQGIM